MNRTPSPEAPGFGDMANHAPAVVSGSRLFINLPAFNRLISLDVFAQNVENIKQELMRDLTQSLSRDLTQSLTQTIARNNKTLEDDLTERINAASNDFTEKINTLKSDLVEKIDDLERRLKTKIAAQ